MALGDVTIYSKDNGNGYPGDINYVVLTGTTVPQILAGEFVTKALGSGNYVSSLASGTAAVNYPVIGNATGNTYLVGIAATSSSEGTAAGQNGQVSVTPIDESLTYLISTLQTSAYYGNPATSQAAYDAMVGSRVTITRTGGTGPSQIGGTYTINATDITSGGLIVEELDIVKFPGKVRFSLRNSLSYLS